MASTDDTDGTLVLPFVPSIGNYRFICDLQGNTYIFDVLWNERASAWFFDILNVDETPVVYGVKIVLGAYLARRCQHPLFDQGVFVAGDLSNQDEEAGFDDLGTRVVIQYIPVQALFGRIGLQLSGDL